MNPVTRYMTCIGRLNACISDFATHLYAHGVKMHKVRPLIAEFDVQVKIALSNMLKDAGLDARENENDSSNERE